MPGDADFHLRATDRELPGLYASCDAWLFATKQEGFGLPILEAMACRTPVIATPAGAAPELLAGGGGELVPHNDPAAMADAIVRMAALTDAAWREISERAWKTASRYTWDDAATLFDEALQAAHQSRLAQC
jgi:glycosyltransferase involved in cell wall biosynthesis